MRNVLKSGKNQGYLLLVNFFKKIKKEKKKKG